MARLLKYFPFAKLIHCVKSVQIRSYFWSVFSCIWTEYGDLQSNLRIQSKYRKIRTRNNSVLGHFSRSDPLFSLLFDVYLKNNFELKLKPFDQNHRFLFYAGGCGLA